MALIDINGLSKSYGAGPGEIRVLDNIEMEIGAGETIAVLGASGAGKSTLLNLMGALDRPTSGDINFNGESVFARSDAKLAAFRSSNVGFVFQFHHLLPEFTALENVMMPGLIGNEEKGELRERAVRLLSEAGLSERFEHKPGELSGGEQQRVAVVRALVRSPEVILADEPTGNLDRKTGDGVFDLLTGFNKEKGTTLVVVTHNEELAARLSRRIKIEDGSMHEL